MRSTRDGEEWFDNLEEALAHARARAASEQPKLRTRTRPAYADILRTGAVALAGWLVLQHLGALGGSKRPPRHGGWSLTG